MPDFNNIYFGAREIDGDISVLVFGPNNDCSYFLFNQPQQIRKRDP